MKVLRFADLVAEPGQVRVRGRRVFIRADLNVPQDDAGNITEDTRIRASVPCIQKNPAGKVDELIVGGSAFLEVLEGKTLPAFEILARRAA